MKVSKRPSRWKHSVKTSEVVERYLASLDCPRALTVLILYRNREYTSLVSLDCEPIDYADPFAFRDAYRATLFLSKNRFLKTSYNKEARAIEKFEESEQKCGETNRRWRGRREFTHDDWHSIDCVARKIHSILGDSPNLQECLTLSSWGPGASLQIKSRDASSYKKFLDERGITSEALPLVEIIDREYPHLAGRFFSVETGDKLVVVPKNSKIDRVILIQPGWNLWFQKGIGQMLRRRLKRSGLDLNTCADINQSKAKSSSLSGDLATIDFTSASDQIAIEPLREILPPDWFVVLDSLRSKRSSSGRTWEKFSSMGNGFTFELETLVFYSLALVSCGKTGVDPYEVSVYGDDVIIPVSALSLFQRLCEIFGFSVNQTKSFSSGCFRESCGSHYFSGVDCKPIFLKEKISSINSVFKMYNRVRSIAHQDLLGLGCDTRFRDLCVYLKDATAKKFRCLVPFGLGDIGFISNFDEAVPIRMRDSIEGYKFRSLVTLPITTIGEEAAILMVRLTEHSDVSRLNNIELKGRTRDVLKYVTCSEWYDLGPWY